MYNIYICIYIKISTYIICLSYFLGNHVSSKKKKNATKIQLSENIAMNPFLQQSVILSGVEGNPFLSNHGNNNQKPFNAMSNISLPQENNVSNIAIFTNNPFLNFGTNTKVDTKSTDAPELVTQVSYKPPESVTSSSYTPASDNPFTTFYTHNPPITIEPPSSEIPSLSGRIPITSGSTKTTSELSK